MTTITNFTVLLPVFVLLQLNQHLLNLSRADHSFISQIESRSRQGTPSQPPNSLPALHYTGDKPLRVAINDGALLYQYQHGYSNHTTIFEGQGILQHSSSSVSLSQGRKQLLSLNHPHSQSCTNLLAQQNNQYSNSSVLRVKGADASSLQDSNIQQQQWAANDSSPHANQMMSSASAHKCNGPSKIASEYPDSVCNGECHTVKSVAINGTASPYVATPTGDIHLGTPTADSALQRQSSSTSSGYGTASSTGTGRHSVISMLSRDQSLSDIDPENSLRVNQVNQRKISAPAPNNDCPPRRKRILNQQSQSLTDLAQNIIEYPHDHEENEHYESEECRGHPSLQRQDTGHSSKVVLASGRGGSISGEHFKSVMGIKKSIAKQTAMEEASGMNACLLHCTTILLLFA